MSRPAPSPESLAAVGGLARRFGWRLVVLFGSLARGEDGRDVDLAVQPAADPGLLEQGGWQATLEELMAPRPVDLVLLHDGLSPLARFEIFRDGRCLYEAQPGLFSAEQDRAFFLYADSEKFRRAEQEMLRG
jgi:predicted nucleotidyltransferase